MANWREIRSKIENNDTFYLLAISGGVDSMVLLDFFNRSKCHFAVVHFNHQLQDCNNDMQTLVENYCNDHSIMFDVGYGYDIVKNAKELGCGMEAEARKQRYEYLESMAIGYGRLYNKEVCIVTAHHLDDQVETVLINMFRGVGLQSIFMEENSNNRFRPFISITKDELIEAANKRNLKWFEDPTNSEIDAERNWLRNEIIPLIKQRRNISKTIPLSISKFKNFLGEF